MEGHRELRRVCAGGPDADRGHRYRVGHRARRRGRLFTAFERLGASDGAIPETGIGLALSKRLLDLMDGAIGVESVVGQGSRFWVELPTTRGVLEACAARGLGGDPGE